MSEPLLEFRDVRSGYGEAVVLDGVSFALPTQGSLAVLGRNGVGKTTLLLTAMGFVTLVRGSVLFKGRDISRLPPHKRASIGLGWVPQEREIFPSLSVEENLTVAWRRGRWDIDAVYGLFPRLKERRVNMGHQLSGGEQQMLTIARTLMGNPRAILLDEPSEGLAPVIVDQMARTIEELKQEGLTVLLSEQNLRFASLIANRALIIETGRIRYQGTLAELQADEEVRAAYLMV
jgi:branched-chain amino acid transport system ATP-binding protein